MKTILSGVAAATLLLSMETASIFAGIEAKSSDTIAPDAAAPAIEAAAETTVVDVSEAAAVTDTAPVYNRVCDYCGDGCTFVDEDGDGVCDYYSNRQTNTGQGYGNANAGQGYGYVDSDNDGVCDNYVEGNCYGNGYGNCDGSGNGYNGGGYGYQGGNRGNGGAGNWSGNGGCGGRGHHGRR